MSGKPASVAAPRAGVAGAPRVLVYVAEARQLEAAAAGPDPPPQTHPPLDTLYLHDNVSQHLALPRNTLYRQQIEQNDQGSTPGTVYYKPFNDSEAKINSFESPENITAHRDEYFTATQSYMKENCMRNDDNKANDRPSSAAVKTDCENSDWSNLDSYNVRLPLQIGELSAYQTRCGPVSDNMPPMLPVGVHGQSQFNDNGVVQSDNDGMNTGERELSVGKSFVNYQLLEQSVSHQSIVNQSINILNQQIGVSRSIVSEGDGGSAPQLVRTADGVVLAVLPSSVLPQSSETPDVRNVHSEFPQTITVPLGWRRIVNGSSVLYISPSGTALSNLAQLREYLQTTGTCKCGLPCPLRPETAFSFDSKVVSKPYQVAAGAELTKLCNHKRKLLASLQSRVQSPVTPPPQPIDQKKVAVPETKKKMKKRPGYVPTMSVSQMMVQRDRPLNEFKPDVDQKRTASPGAMTQRPSNMQHCLPYSQQNMPNVVQEDIKQETLVQRSSHYLTVSSGWITQHPENIESGQKHNPQMPGPLSNPLNMGLPVLGTNGQVIGVNTSYNKHSNNAKNTLNLTPHVIEQEHKEEENDLQTNKQTPKEEESQIFCGLNQPLTPEVMQKINEQQQIFIQRNQKQIEVMKGYKTQISDNLNQSKPPMQSQYVPQGQLVIQNGTVVKTNSAKTPPWQVKRNDSNTPNSMPCPSPKLQKVENFDYDDTNMNTMDESSSSAGSYSGSEQILNPVMCSRVPPLPQHYNMMGQQWPSVEIKKRTKNNNKTPKKKSIQSDKPIMYGNNGMRQMPEPKGKSCDDGSRSTVPSFMDDPNGYLAQQTVLLNNTISRQVGINTRYNVNQFENTGGTFNSTNQADKLCKPMSRPAEPMNVFRNNIAPNSSPSPNNIPDSSLVPEKSVENTIPPCCKGCNVSYKGNCSDTSDTRTKYLKQHANVYGIEMESGVATSSPKHGFDDNPVTSSTYIERNLMLNDNCGPIQAGVVSTSNVSPNDTLQPPEPSPTLSTSSRNTDTPHSSGSNPQLQNCTFPVPSPAYSNPSSSRDNFNSNPSTPGSSHTYPYNSPGPPVSQAISGNQVMHFISNHNVNKNLMEVDNISMVGVKPGLRNQQELLRLESKKRIENTMPGYCPPPHLGGGPPHSLIQACYIQTFVTTMASGFSVTRDTVTSVLAGKANTATTSINASQANFVRPPPPPSVNMATTYAIPNNQPDPFLNSVNLPTSYPLHIAGTTAQNMIAKSPLEMVQNVISSLPSKPETSNAQPTSIIQRRSCSNTPGQILISSTGQIIVSNNQMPPPPPKNTTALSPIGSNAVTNVTTSVAQVVPAVGGVQPIVNQPTVVVNTLQTPFVIQPPMMTVEGQVVQQNTVLPQIVTGGIVSGQQTTDSSRQIEVKSGQGFVQGVAMLSPESLKKRSKKKKNQAPNITNVLQIAAPQQNPSSLMVHHSSPQHNSSPQFSPRGFQLSPTNNISPTPMLQALTIVPGKSGAPAHIVMNGQGNTSNFGSQQIIANTSPSQQINLLQPVNLINNASNVMSNFPAFQQFILPNLGGMVMTADGTAIIQDNSTGMPMQLQLQTVNGQNVLTPVQNPGLFTAGTNSGVVIRAQNQQGKIIQSQHSPGAQFLSPNGQVMVNSPNFNGQLSPLLANLSPTGVTFNTSPQMRSGSVQSQEFIQTNQLGQTLMVPLSPKQAAAPAPGSRANSTFVQNTTIVQQQTTLVSSAHGAAGVRHSVSTQTLGRARAAAGSPPDTTTRSPDARDARDASPRRADTTSRSPEPDAAAAMEHCVSSSQQDERWPERAADDSHHMMSNIQLMRLNRANNPVESSEMQYNQNMNSSSNSQHVLPMTSSLYDRPPSYKRKNDFGDGSTYRNDKIMRTNYGMVHGLPKEYDALAAGQDKQSVRRFSPSGSNPESSNVQKVFDRHLGSGDDGKSAEEAGGRRFAVGDLVWGPVRGHASWPGKLQARLAGGAWRVRWFGRGAGAAEHRALLTLSEGLEAHHAARTRHRKSRKLNTLLENAIQEAMAELDKKSDPRRAPSADRDEGPPGDITETPRRSRAPGRVRSKHRRNPGKLDATRLRSSR
ncbi:uncharacterized protein LOC124532396 isoform X3 [Vanessa cardui]|uniref:uncharacterized protein LOC124532396 isoform X2 n=1 Tax=Vanessa cardui TaxID=171605 RepID=UPI001F12BEB6|nr:uncharacterized protein LOC124532396 isoform X2 [Vanessa cardui]XP_046963252.1 uncharacterized protein LOC124532396 isoform X3 [Vanessa cardui]